MKSARLGDELEAKLRRVAAAEGKTESEILRLALSSYCDTALSARLDLRMADYIGAIDSGGMDLAAKAGHVAAAMIMDEHLRQTGREGRDHHPG